MAGGLGSLGEVGGVAGSGLGLPLLGSPTTAKEENSWCLLRA